MFQRPIANKLSLKGYIFQFLIRLIQEVAKNLQILGYFKILDKLAYSLTSKQATPESNQHYPLKVFFTSHFHFSNIYINFYLAINDSKKVKFCI